jgi:Zinc dependent phospholipase C
MKQKRTTGLSSLLASILLLASIAAPSYSYAVLTHQAIIDFSWRHILKPHLHKRYPSASDGELELSRAYAYGGAIIQDMGYFPFSNPFYSDLAHYVRSGDFVEALINDAQNLNEYAFALGALEHYCADTNGHPLATNKAVAVFFPKLRAQYGSSVTYEDDQTAHSRVEFGFDVLEVAENHYPSEIYHDRKGFKVAKQLLERAFKETYGLELSQILKHEDLAISSYSDSILKWVPRATEAAWANKRELLLANYPNLTRKEVVIPPSGISDQDRPLGYYTPPGFSDRISGFFVSHFSKRGPLTKLDVIVPNAETEKLFRHSRVETHLAYEARIKDIETGGLHLPNLDFDTGEPTRLGEYGLADDAYAKLLDLHAKNGFKAMTPALKAKLLSFFNDSNTASPKKNDTGKWAHTRSALEQLKQVNP